MVIYLALLRDNIPIMASFYVMSFLTKLIRKGHVESSSFIYTPFTSIEGDYYNI